MFKLASNIHAQPESLAGTRRHHAGPGAGAMTDAVILLRSGKKIVITGMGASLFASIALQYLLCSQGLDTVVLEAGELLHYLSPTWRDAVVLMVSRSGESVAIARLYLLAREACFASAQEAALLLHEVAKSPAVAMPIASFRHGQVEVVDPNFRGFIFAPQDGTRDLNLALAHDVVAFGGQIRIVGPASGGERFAPWCDVPAAPATLAPLFEIVPMQVAAYQMAVLRGVQPGSLGFAPQVAVDEASFQGGSQ